MGVLAALLSGGGIAAAFVATLIGQESEALYIGCAAAAGLGLLLMLAHVWRTRAGGLPVTTLAPVAIAAALLGIAASGASCGVACIAWGTPAAAASLVLPDVRGWFQARRPLRRI